MQKGAQAYNQTSVTTTSPGQVLLILYDGAINFLVRAKAKINEKDYAGKGILISKAMDIISELDSSLNPGKGQDLAENLHNLYFWCNTRLATANLKMDTAIVDEVIKIMAGLRSAYAQIIDTPEAMGAAQEIVTGQTPSAGSSMRTPVAFTQQAAAQISGAKRSSLYAQQGAGFGAAPAQTETVAAQEKVYTPAAAKTEDEAAQAASKAAPDTPPVQEQSQGNPQTPPPLVPQGFGAGAGRNAMARYAAGFGAK